MVARSNIDFLRHDSLVVNSHPRAFPSILLLSLLPLLLLYALSFVPTKALLGVSVLILLRGNPVNVCHFGEDKHDDEEITFEFLVLNRSR